MNTSTAWALTGDWYQHRPRWRAERTRPIPLDVDPLPSQPDPKSRADMRAIFERYVREQSVETDLPTRAEAACEGAECSDPIEFTGEPDMAAVPGAFNLFGKSEPKCVSFESDLPTRARAGSLNDPAS